MKKMLQILITIIAIILIGIFLISLYKNSILNNLKSQEAKVDGMWEKVCEKINNRNHTLADVVNGFKKLEYNDETQNPLSETKFFSDSIVDCDAKCTLEFMEYQYKVNKLYLKFVNVYKSNDKLQKDSSFFLLKSIEKSDLEINKMKIAYNNLAVSYNEYYSNFPNFFIAKDNGLLRKIVFEITYGIENQDPIIKHNNPDWAKGVDTL